MNSTETAGRGRRVEVVGEVVSDKMQKTIAVQIFRMVRHKKYGKFMRRSSIFKAHDEKGEAKAGDVVRIVHTRPLSKTKRWTLKEVLQKGRRTAEVNA
ncbi:MAG: 30S ribosomal protein S17 [Bdellovibrionaceae bacterium]|jgi:small subunit ribosomal protein S17|nr:30S ribosomal protein S17 [Pseudobdellovibrionaceae bacterium]